MANGPIPLISMTAAAVLRDADLIAVRNSLTGLFEALSGATLRNQVLGRTVSIGNLPSGGSIGTAAATVDNYDVAILSQTTATVLLSNPTPSDTSKYRTFRWYNGGTVPMWSAYGQYVQVGGFAEQVYIPGTGWKGVGTKYQQTICITTTAVAFPLDTAENNITLLTVPGGFAAAGSAFEIAYCVDNTSGTSNKQVKGKFGTFVFSDNTPILSAAASFFGIDKRVYLPTTSSQSSVPAGLLNNGAASTSSAIITGTANTASDTDIRVSVQKTTGADVTTLRFAHIRYTHGA